MKILLLISESWNDVLYPNNNMTNWFYGMGGVEIATIYCNPALPQNQCCSRYFQLTEKSMVKSLLSPQKAGRFFTYNFEVKERNIIREENRRGYKFFRSIACELVRLLRDIIWATGRINKCALKQFITEFDPDIIFTQRMGSIKMCRIERIVKRISNAPMVAYTGDDEYSLRQYNLSLMYWLRKFWLRHELAKNIPMYSLFYSQSKKQMEEFRNKFNSNMKFLVKCGSFDEKNIHSTINKPIILTYAGKLYCNRWKTLALLAACIAQVNSEEKRFELNIYTRDKVTPKQFEQLHDGINSFIRAGVSADELKKIYQGSDILLHVESFDKTYSLITKYSFSTKIMECLSSGCAVMAIGKREQAGCEYLREQDAALVASSKKELLDILVQLRDNSNLLIEYAHKAYQCGMRNHQRENIQKQLISDFRNLI